MKFLVICLSFIATNNVLAQINPDANELKKEDQTYFKNDYGEGLNKFERIDMATKHINQVMGEVQSLKKEIDQLKARVEELEKAKTK
jgi:peptidoglycan hydrolase CwlO-like protein